jgi:hypothetical protein
MDSKNDIRQLQQLNDAIAITLDAIRRVAPAAWSGMAARNEMGWIPAPGAMGAPGERGARLEHSAWPAWGMEQQPVPMQAQGWSWPSGFAHSGWAGPSDGWQSPWQGPASWPAPAWSANAWAPGAFWGHRRPF